MEIWKEVEDWPYFVSSLGRVRNARGRVLTPRIHTHGYHRITLCDGKGRRRDEYIHRMVCLAFNGEPPDPACHADHIDADRANNSEQNIRWLSPSLNRASRKMQNGSARWNAKLDDDIVRAMRANPENSIHLAERFGISRKYLRVILANKVWKHVL